jgi:hypothetical protein
MRADTAGFPILTDIRAARAPPFSVVPLNCLRSRRLSIMLKLARPLAAPAALFLTSS